MAYLFQKVLVPGAAVKIAPVAAALPDSAADLKAKLAAIDALQKPHEMPAQAWGEYKAGRKAQLKVTWRNREAVQAMEAGEEDMFDGEGGERDPFAPLLDALREEMAQLREFHAAQFALWMQNTDEWAKKAPYGTPLGPKVDARYQFWPQRKKEWPLLYFCATQLLAGSKASTCGIERAHFVSGRICSKLRGSLLPDTVERLTLAYYYMRREVEEQMRLWGEKALRNLELEDILEVEVAVE